MHCRLPEIVAAACKQQECPIGHAVLQFRDAVVAAETCEELFTPMAPNIQLALSGPSSISLYFNTQLYHLTHTALWLGLVRPPTAFEGGE